MPQSFKCKLKKLNNDGKITTEELEGLLQKLEGHDAKVRADTIDECISKIDTLETSSFAIGKIYLVKSILEQLKEEKNE